MSISFIVEVEMPRHERVSPCLCAQFAPLWSALFRGESDDWASLAEHARESCAGCKGTGVEVELCDSRPQVNFATANARIVAGAMGLDLADDYGSVELAVFRRGLLRARNVSQPSELRAPEAGPRAHVAGYSSDDLSRALGCLETLAREATSLGAARIRWE